MGINAGDTAWIIVAAALVLFMTPGLAFFYGGMVRSKNVLGMLAQNYVTMGVVSVLWILFVYSIAFSGKGRFIGDLHQFGLAHISEPPTGLALTIPPIVFVSFQLMFAIITPALITGGVADRMKFISWILFAALWLVLVYAPITHWVFSPSGWIAKRGVEDFAGGIVVEANSGISTLALVLVLGRRRGWPQERMRPHNLPLVLVGAGILWFGWFGFNAGSALAANTLSAFAFINTNTAAATGLLGWLLVERYRDGKPTTLGAASGAIAGMVAITPACGFVSPVGSIFIGLIAGMLCAFAVNLKHKYKFDDALDVVAVHFVGGVIGMILLGFLGTQVINGKNGLFYGGGFHLLWVQVSSLIIASLYAFTVTLAIAYFLKKTIGLRVTDEQEYQGMDLTFHGETAYESPGGMGR